MSVVNERGPDTFDLPAKFVGKGVIIVLDLFGTRGWQLFLSVKVKPHKLVGL